MSNEIRDIEGKFAEKAPQTLKQRFYSRVFHPNENGCMIWGGAKTKAGYGQIIDYLNKPKCVAAHRYSYALHFGVFDSSLYVLHKCDNPSCVAPEHLFLGTQQDNINDCKIKKRRNDKPRYGESNPSCKITNKDVIEIRNLLLSGMKSKDVAAKFNVSRQTIRNSTKRAL